jgi:hypothetical protein
MDNKSPSFMKGIIARLLDIIIVAVVSLSGLVALYFLGGGILWLAMYSFYR